MNTYYTLYVAFSERAQHIKDWYVRKVEVNEMSRALLWFNHSLDNHQVFPGS